MWIRLFEWFQSFFSLRSGKQRLPNSPVNSEKVQGLNLENCVFPVAQINGARPRISDGFGSAASGKRGGRGHLGVDIMYRRSKNGESKLHTLSRGYIMPDNIPCFAVFAGTVHAINVNDRHGVKIEIDHHNIPGVGLRVSVYRHTRRPKVSVGQHVVAGTELGDIAFDPTGGDSALNHLHFEWWDVDRPRISGKSRRDAFSVDPEEALFPFCRFIQFNKLPNPFDVDVDVSHIDW